LRSSTHSHSAAVRAGLLGNLLGQTHKTRQLLKSGPNMSPMFRSFRKYIWQCARLSLRSSWAVANGILGSLLGAVAVAVLGTIVSPFRLLLINNASIHRTEASVQELLRDLITLTITRVRFDPNGPSELYVYYELLNPGEQTILRNWRLLIRTAKRSDPIIITPRFIETGRHENIENNPIERGGKREGKFGFTFGGAAKDIVGDRGATFNLSAVDVKGRKIEASYSCNTIADHD